MLLLLVFNKRTPVCITTEGALYKEYDVKKDGLRLSEKMETRCKKDSSK